MRYAIVGNIKGFTYERVKKELDKIGVCHSDIIVSGGAEGVDDYAQQYAKHKGCTIVIHYPNPTLPSPQRFFERNQKVVLASDIVIAFNKKEFGGTTNTMNFAKKQNREVIVFGWE